MSIYLDHNATTPLDPRVWAAMTPYLRDYYANPSSVHTPGRLVRTAVDQALCIGCGVCLNVCPKDAIVEA